MVAAHINLIDNIFQKLTTLYFKSTMKISAQYIIGQLLGTEAAADQMVGSVVPLATLESLCESAVSFSDILVIYDACSCTLFSIQQCLAHIHFLQSFLQVCKCLHTGLQLTTSQRDEVKVHFYSFAYVTYGSLGN